MTKGKIIVIVNESRFTGFSTQGTVAWSADLNSILEVFNVGSDSTLWRVLTLSLDTNGDEHQCRGPWHPPQYGRTSSRFFRNPSWGVENPQDLTPLRQSLPPIHPPKENVHSPLQRRIGSRRTKIDSREIYNGGTESTQQCLSLGHLRTFCRICRNY